MRTQYKLEKCHSPKFEKPLSKENIHRISPVQTKRQSNFSYNIPPIYFDTTSNIPVLQNGQLNPQNIIIASSRQYNTKRLVSIQRQRPTQGSNSPQPYEKMIFLYKRQNENLKKQNSFLIDELRLQKRKELNYKKKITQLQQVIAGFSISDDNEQIDNQQFLQSQVYQGLKFSPNHKVYRQSRLGQSYQDVTNANIQNLSKDFYQLIMKCSRQKHPSKKKQLRKSLARLAKQMKTLRNLDC